jgi:riboflavin synthase
MFTGIISDLGEVIEIGGSEEARLTIASRYPAHSIALGASIACSGVCLTVTHVRELGDGRSAFSVLASAETLRRTTIQRWVRGTKINLERALKLGDELGGHIVSGHVDGTADIVSIRRSGESKTIGFRPPISLMPFIATKGSICLDGTSLTVNEVKKENFTVNLIPHTLAVTAWGLSCEGDAVNLEIDMLARYVAKLREFEWRN